MCDGSFGADYNDMNNYTLYGNPETPICLLRLTGEHEKELIEYELAWLRENCGENGWCVAYIPVEDWENDLVPWKRQPDGTSETATGADATLTRIVDGIINDISSHCQAGTQRYYLAGYSLAGLFALWASYQTDTFAGIAAVSPSVWYPGWMEYAAEHKCLTSNIYLSLGSKEHKTRNKLMSCVRDNITALHSSLLEKGFNTVLEFNEGNHFTDPGKRITKGIKWLLENDK